MARLGVGRINVHASGDVIGVWMATFKHCWAVDRQPIPLHWRESELSDSMAYLAEPTANLWAQVVASDPTS